MEPVAEPAGGRVEAAPGEDVDDGDEAVEARRMFGSPDYHALIAVAGLETYERDRGLDETADVDLTALARAAASELAASAREGRVDLSLPVEDALTVRGDRILLRHLLTNIIRNALQYNHPGGRVRVAVERQGLTVTNTGPPVPADTIPALFEPFRRLSADRTATTGHGLGLPIAASIAEAHHAELTAAPGVQGGLTVALRFLPPR